MSNNNFDVQKKIGKPWNKPPLVGRKWLRWALFSAFIVYLILAYMTIEVNWSRVYVGLERGKKFILAFTKANILLVFQVGFLPFCIWPKVVGIFIICLSPLSCNVSNLSF